MKKYKEKLNFFKYLIDIIYNFINNNIINNNYNLFLKKFKIIFKNMY